MRKTVGRTPGVHDRAGAFAGGDPIQRAGCGGGYEWRGENGRGKKGVTFHTPTFAGADSRMSHAAGMLRSTAPIRNQAGVIGLPLA